MSACFATVIFAMPPTIRLTALGLLQVPGEMTEAADSFGTTRWQKLMKVQLPLALPTIMAGINQTIMLSLSMVVIAAMIGAGGLGREVWSAIQRLRPGAASKRASPSRCWPSSRPDHPAGVARAQPALNETHKPKEDSMLRRQFWRLFPLPPHRPHSVAVPGRRQGHGQDRLCRVGGRHRRHHILSAALKQAATTRG